MEVFSQEKIIYYLEKLLAEQAITGLVFAEAFPPPVASIKRIQVFKEARFSWSLGGETELQFASDGKIVSTGEKKGEMTFFRPLSWNSLPYRKNCLGFSAVLHQNYLRLTYSKVSGTVDNYDFDGWSYHIEDTFSNTARSLVYAVDSMADRPECKEIAIKILRLALEVILVDLKKSKPAKQGKSYEKWCHIISFIDNNFTANISRFDLADLLDVTPFYISKLFTRFSNMSFPQYLNLQRLEHAAWLLKSTNFTLDEIAYQCGYSQTSYFSQKFHEKFKVSPGKYRQSK